MTQQQEIKAIWFFTTSTSTPGSPRETPWYWVFIACLTILVFCKFLTKNRTFIQFITDASYSRLNVSTKKKIPAHVERNSFRTFEARDTEGLVCTQYLQCLWETFRGQLWRFQDLLFCVDSQQNFDMTRYISQRQSLLFPKYELSLLSLHFPQAFGVFYQIA